MARPGASLTPLVLPLLAVTLGTSWALWRRRRGALMRSVPVAYRHWTEVLRDQVLRPFIVEKRNDEVRNRRLFDTSIGEKSPPRLIEGSEPRRLVVTEAMTQVSAMAQIIHAGSLGISGPRGVGKSTILQFFGTDEGVDGSSDLRLVVPAPVDYEPRKFIVHLFSRLCQAVPHGPADRSDIAAETRRHLEQLRYLRTYTASGSASLSLKSVLTLAQGSAKQRAEQPVTLPELVDSFRGYSARAGGLPRDLVRTARALIDVAPAGGEGLLPDTAVDLVRRELDLLRQVSGRQLAENAGPGSLLAALHDRRWPGAAPFTDAALQLAGTAQATESDATRQLCQELVVWLSFYGTMLEVFNSGRERLVACLKDGDHAFIDDLAAIRYAMRVNAGLAHILLEQYRLRYPRPRNQEGTGSWR